MAFTFKKAVKSESRLRLALAGPAGSGKTYTMLALLTELAQGKPIAVIDTEHGSASKYSDLFAFDVLELDSFNPQNYIDAIKAAEQEGYAALGIDSMSHAWMGKDGALELVDKAAARSQSRNSYMAWRDVTPLQTSFIDAIIGSRLHVVATLRTKTEYVIETGANGKQAPRKIGLAPIQRDQVEYEFDVYGEMTADNELIVGKTRCPDLAGKVFPKPGKNVADILVKWLHGAPPPAREEQAVTFTRTVTDSATPTTVIDQSVMVEPTPVVRLSLEELEAFKEKGAAPSDIREQFRLFVEEVHSISPETAAQVRMPHQNALDMEWLIELTRLLKRWAVSPRNPKSPNAPVGAK